MLHAIGLIQDVQLTAFAIVLILMAIRDRANLSLRWLACAYIAGFCGALFDFGYRWLPDWFSITFGTLAAPVGYACLHAGFVSFVRRGQRTRWFSLVLVAGSLPLYLWWSVGKHFQHIGAISTLGDLCLATQTALMAWLLLTTRDSETAWPRRVLGVFLSIYSAVELVRVILFAITGQIPDLQFPSIELTSAIVYVVSRSILPLGFTWMMNTRLYAHMLRQMTTDSLTGLLNRRGIEQAGEAELTRYVHARPAVAQEFAVVVADIDQFKQLNDAYGHAGGDAVLCDVTALFQRQVRASDLVGRLGGEEFVFVLPATEADGAMQLAERLRMEVEQRVFTFADIRARTTVSFGVTATGHRSDISWALLLGEADAALYAAKHAGRNHCCMFSAEMARKDANGVLEELPA